MRTKVKTMRRPRGEKTQSKTINLPTDQCERITRIASRSNRSFSWVLSDLLSQKDLAVSEALDRRMVEAPTPILPSGSTSGLDDITEILAAVRDEDIAGLRGRVNSLPGELETTLSTAIAVAIERETEVLRDEIRGLRRELNTKLSTQEFREFDESNVSMMATVRDQIIEGIANLITETNQGSERPRTSSATKEPQANESKSSPSQSLEITVETRVTRALTDQLETLRTSNQIDLEKAFQAGGSKSPALYQTVESLVGHYPLTRIAVASMASTMAAVNEKATAIPADQFAVAVSLIDRHLADKDGRENRHAAYVPRIAGALARVIAQGAFENLAPETEDRIDAALANLQKGAALDDVVAAVDQAITSEPQYKIQ
jgi:hypothetical protein